MSKSFLVVAVVIAFSSACRVSERMANYRHVYLQKEGRETKEWKLIWKDDFEGKSLDTTKWTRIPSGTSDWNRHMRLVATQDARQRAENKWMFTKYDAFGRVVVTGIWSNNNAAISRSDAQTLVNQNTSYYWETRQILHDYTSQAWPTTFDETLTVNYYDNYTIPNLPDQYHFLSSIDVPGLATASLTRILGATAGHLLWSVMYYDVEGNVIKTFQQHYLNGTLNANNYDEITNEYYFTREVKTSKREHYINVNNAASLSVTVFNEYKYDHAGRKTEIWQQINNDTPVLISKTDYNELGQATTKHLHGTASTGPFLQDLNYSYNERGWVRTISGSNSKFNLDLRYQNPSAGTPQYNGNISQQFYTGDYSGSKNFQYIYDKLNRLTNAVSNTGTLNESMAYDRMGNILTLNRSGQAYGALSYAYHGGQSNQLASVSGSGFTTRSYQYDGNGNATGDGVAKAIEYNLLNLPAVVKHNNTPLATYTYTASGAKLRSTGSDGSWDYINGIHYKNGQIAFIQTEEGKAEPNGGSSYKYVYNLKDHLGNVRVSVDEYNNQARVIQEDEYYSFGLQKPLYNYSNNNRYLYNGKEKQVDLEDQYDYGMRFYDPVIGRFNVIDRFAEKYVDFTPYQYGGNNPVLNIDVNGDSLRISHKGKDYLYENGKLYQNGAEYTGKVKGFLKQSVKALGTISQGQEGASMISELQSSTNNFTIVKGNSEFNASNTIKAHANQLQTDPAQAGTLQALTAAGRSLAGGSGGIISWDPSGAMLPTTSGGKTSGTTDLAHEMFHGLDANRGRLDDRVNQGIKRDEWQAVYRENVLRGQIGQPLRTHYIKSIDPSGAYIGGSGVRMITPANQPIRPAGY